MQRKRKLSRADEQVLRKAQKAVAALARGLIKDGETNHHAAADRANLSAPTFRRAMICDEGSPHEMPSGVTLVLLANAAGKKGLTWE